MYKSLLRLHEQGLTKTLLFLTLFVKWKKLKIKPWYQEESIQCAIGELCLCLQYHKSSVYVLKNDELQPIFYAYAYQYLGQLCKGFSTL